MLKNKIIKKYTNNKRIKNNRQSIEKTFSFMIKK